MQNKGITLKEFGKRLLVRYSLNECLEGGSLEARLCPTLAKCLLSTSLILFCEC